MTKAVAAALALLLALPCGAFAQDHGPTGALAAVTDAAEPQRAEPAPGGIETSLSPQCLVPGSQLYTLAPLRGVKRALKEHRTVRVLAIGSSSTFGVGASAPVATYPARLEGELERLFPGVEVEMVNGGVNGERAAGQAGRMQDAVREARPDLVIWQVGTNDALAMIEPDAVKRQVRETAQWLKRRKIDLVLVDLQYTPQLAAHENYGRMVAALDEVAREDALPLVRRYDAMRYLARGGEAERYLAGDRFHLNDLGYRCMAEHVARGITLGLLQAEAPAEAEDAAREAVLMN